MSRINPTRRRSPRIPGDDLQAEAIDAPEGEKTMLVPMITFMSRERVTRCAR